jgi:hypothetical protein
MVEGDGIVTFGLPFATLATKVASSAVIGARRETRPAT